MPRINPELEALKMFCTIVVRFTEPSNDPSAAMWQRFVASLANVKRVDQMRMAAASFVEMLVDLKGPELQRLDEQLSAAGAPTLTAMRSTDEKQLMRIFARGHIRTEAEWRLLKSRLDDMAFTGWSAEQRALADKLASDFEFRQ